VLLASASFVLVAVDLGGRAESGLGFLLQARVLANWSDEGQQVRWKGGTVEVTISSQGIELPDPVRVVVRRKLEAIARHLPGEARAEVRFLRQHSASSTERDCCDIVLHAPGFLLAAKAQASGPGAAVDRAATKLRHQVEKAKARSQSVKRPSSAPVTFF
jgi:ribosomal subunit interface protein